jgi:mitogen-activated protein kinase organizer 1
MPNPVRAQSRQAIQVLEEARDAVQALHIGSTYITTGSLDGHVRTYDLRKGELRSDFIGCSSLHLVFLLQF